MIFEQKHSITGENISYSIEPRLLKFLKEKVGRDLEKRDKDYPLLIDGYEGAGKSTFAQQIGFVVDPSLTLDRVCMTADEFRRAIYNAQPNQCVIYDEAVTGMTAADSISRVGKLLKSLMMQMRQKNLFVIIILPTIFEFNKYAVLSRAKAFFHIYEMSGIRGYFVVGTSLAPTVAQNVGTAQADGNITGASDTLLGLTTLFYCLAIATSSMASAAIGLRNAGWM